MHPATEIPLDGDHHGNLGQVLASQDFIAVDVNLTAKSATSSISSTNISTTPTEIDFAKKYTDQLNVSYNHSAILSVYH